LLTSFFFICRVFMEVICSLNVNMIL